jgi:hypothetical protein
MPQLPQELLNKIIDLLWLNPSEQLVIRKRILSSYASACKQFASHVQPHLFKNLVLRTSACSSGLHELLKTRPMLKRLIMSIDISPNYNGTQDVFTCLVPESDLLHRLMPDVDLTIGYLVLDERWAHTIHAFPQTRLTLRSSTISSEASFRRLLSWFPQLHDLQLMSVQFTWQALSEPPNQDDADSNNTGIADPVLSQPLRSLLLHGLRSTTDAIATWFIRCQIGHNLKSLSVHHYKGQTNIEVGKQLIIHHGASLKSLTFSSPPSTFDDFHRMSHRRADIHTDFQTKGWSMAECVNLESLSIGQANTERDLPWIVYQLRMLPKRNALSRLDIAVTLYAHDFDRAKLRKRAWPPAFTNMDTLIATWDLPGVQQITWTIHCGKTQQHAMPNNSDFAVIMPKAYARKIIQPIQYNMW